MKNMLLWLRCWVEGIALMYHTFKTHEQVYRSTGKLNETLLFVEEKPTLYIAKGHHWFTPISRVPDETIARIMSLPIVSGKEFFKEDSVD